MEKECFLRQPNGHWVSPAHDWISVAKFCIERPEWKHLMQFHQNRYQICGAVNPMMNLWQGYSSAMSCMDKKSYDTDSCGLCRCLNMLSVICNYSRNLKHNPGNFLASGFIWFSGILYFDKTVITIKFSELESSVFRTDI